jgi:lipopolysaccharide export system protein LptC
MSAGTGGSVPAAKPRGGREIAAAWPRPTPPRLRLRERNAGDHYSRRVAMLKRVLPIVGLTLLTLVAIWPRLGPLLESVRLGFPLIDLREARELRMLNPRYAGIDRYNRPYVVTAAVGRQVANRDDLMALERPRAEMMMHHGALVVVSAATAMYQAQAQLLDLFDDVTLVHGNGTRFVTRTAHIDVAADTAEGHDPVSGQGPSGEVTAQGFRILDKGNTVIFSGKSNVLLKGSRPNPHPTASPPALPADVEEAAARIERLTVAEPPPSGGLAPVTPSAEAPARPGATSQSRTVAKRNAKLPLRAGKAKHDAS